MARGRYFVFRHGLVDNNYEVISFALHPHASSWNSGKVRPLFFAPHITEASESMAARLTYSYNRLQYPDGEMQCV
jgi:hypothetical protein